MSKQKHNGSNQLAHYRKRIRYTQTEVSRLAGFRDHSVISSLEVGRSLPKLDTALKLAIIYRVPVEFLYRDLFLELRVIIREQEARSLVGQQGVLPLAFAC